MSMELNNSPALKFVKIKHRDDFTASVPVERKFHSLKPAVGVSRHCLEQTEVSGTVETDSLSTLTNKNFLEVRDVHETLKRRRKCHFVQFPDAHRAGYQADAEHTQSHFTCFGFLRSPFSFLLSSSSSLLLSSQYVSILHIEVKL